MNLDARQLDLFADSPTMVSRPASDGPVPATPAPSVPPAVSPDALQPLSLSLAPPAELPAGARWRQVQGACHAIGFVLVRSRRKSIGLTVNDDGLQVTAPGWVPLRQIDAAVIEKERWILEKLAQRQARQKQLAMADTQWEHGGTIPYLGVRICLALEHTGHGHVFKGKPFSPTAGDKLLLPLPYGVERSRIRDSAHGWLQAQAKEWFEQRLTHFLNTNGLSMRRWRLSSAATRWGSCSSDGNIMLNWRLIHFEPDVIDYVIAHEVAHLRHMNHSKDFWREVGRILPGFERARDTLRQHDPATLPLI